MNHRVTFEGMKNIQFAHTLAKQSGVGGKGGKRLIAIVEDCCVVYEIRHKGNSIPANDLEEAVSLYNNIELNKGE